MRHRMVGTMILLAVLLLVMAVALPQTPGHSYPVVGPVLKGQMQWTVVEVRKDGIAIIRPMVAPDWGISGAVSLGKGTVLTCEPKNVPDVSAIGVDGLPVNVHHLELECSQ